MARTVLLCDGFDHYTGQTGLDDKWLGPSESVTPTTGSGFTWVAGRVDGNALEIASGSAVSSEMGVVFPGVGLNVKKASAADRTVIFHARSGTAFRDVELIWKADGTFHLIDGTGTDLGSTGSIYNTGTDYYLEFFGDSRNGGSWSLYVNGNLDQSWISVTTGTGSGSIDYTFIGGKTTTTGAVLTVDDVVFSTDTSNSTVIYGELRIKYLIPDAEDSGALNAWVVTGAATAHEAVDEVPASTADYIQWTGGEVIERFGFQDVSEDVAAEQVIAYWKGDSAGNFTQIDFVSQFAGVAQFHGVRGLLNTYKTRVSCNPNSSYFSSPKTAVNFNNSEFGIRRLSRQPFAAQVLIEVIYTGSPTPVTGGWQVGSVAFA